jgi:hypothetical protein
MDVDPVDHYLKMPKDVFIYFVLEGKLKGKDLVGLCVSDPRLNKRCNESRIFDILLERDFGMTEYKGMKGRELYVFLHSNVFRVYMKEGSPYITNLTYEVKFADREKPLQAGKGMSILLENVFKDNNVPEINIIFDDKFKSFFSKGWDIYYCSTEDLKANVLICARFKFSGLPGGIIESFDVSNNDFELKFGEKDASEIYEEIGHEISSGTQKSVIFFKYKNSHFITCQKIVLKGN